VRHVNGTRIHVPRGGALKLSWLDENQRSGERPVRFPNFHCADSIVPALAKKHEGLRTQSYLE
jgi:hypothetical protein